MSELRFAHAINRALDDAMARDETVVLLGEDIGKAGGIFAATRGLQERYGPERVIDMPIAENAISGAAVGLALGGFRPVIEIMFMDFMAFAMDAVVNQAAKLHFMFGGQAPVPLGVARIARPGRDLTIVTYGAMLFQALAAAETLAARDIEAEVIDLRTIQPWDEAAVLESLSRTHRLVVAHEAVEAFGAGAEIAARMAQIGFDELDGPIQRVGGAFMPVPFGRALEAEYMPGEAEIVAAALATYD